MVGAIEAGSRDTVENFKRFSLEAAKVCHCCLTDLARSRTLTPYTPQKLCLASLLLHILPFLFLFRFVHERGFVRDVRAHSFGLTIWVRFLTLRSTAPAVACGLE